MEKSCLGRAVKPQLIIAVNREGLFPSETFSSNRFFPLITYQIYRALSGDRQLNTSLTSPGKGSKEAKPLKRSRNRILLSDAGNETNCKVPLWEDRKQ
ncbi:MULTISPECIES: hypothetical protein [unclassified Erwinia]|uniref:hypothetical protein n=1 Tax=unclassified Erwinia TaxID=2622719 RepID=UPI000C1A35D4|nr:MULTISPECIES: hypothetical protein [unclassified Erwinia]PIJ48350.1 hypothetical protein BV501_17535 [Erwinia sp. OAMSP11]PIJ68703.1 hypothetical protein BK416_16260 [Erwinia sp. OLSSP12]PIJ78851.1 hypothetical protein BLD47_16480 [Erwinia sp. OLCASP19]PIJ79821.1 hypothetical protein BLD46_16600 [Erwinia sp. OLMTSP26]PIJ81226.1 hypothetical protein BLD49_16735 [Erwinia sp. OLMDSP33]